MTPHYAIVASERFVYVWQFAKLLAGKLAGGGVAADADLISLRQSSGRERVLDVETDAAVAMESFAFPDDPDERNCEDPARDSVPNHSIYGF